MGSLQQPASPNKGIADIVFCIDCTGSMKPTFDGVKNHVDDFVSGLEADDQMDLDWRVRVLGYRDIEVDDDVFIDKPFVENVPDFQDQVNNLEAKGGGDEPESTLDAIYKAMTDSDWRERCNRVIVVLTDQVPHPELSSSTVQPSEPKDLDHLFDMIVGEKQVMLFLVGPDCPEYNQIGQLDDTFYETVDIQNDGLTGVDFNRLMNMIGKTVSMSTDVPSAS